MKMKLISQNALLSVTFAKKALKTYFLNRDIYEIRRNFSVMLSVKHFIFSHTKRQT